MKNSFFEATDHETKRMSAGTPTKGVSPRGSRHRILNPTFAGSNTAAPATKLTKAQRAKKWRDENPEKEKARVARWLSTNKVRKAATDANWQKDNKEKCIAYHRKSNKKARLYRRSWLDNKKAKPCQDCNNEFPPCCMDFDHRVGSVKINAVGEMIAGGWSLELVEIEIQKCDLVCANCHRIRTQERLKDA